MIVRDQIQMECWAINCTLFGIFMNDWIQLIYGKASTECGAFHFLVNSKWFVDDNSVVARSNWESGLSLKMNQVNLPLALAFLQCKKSRQLEISNDYIS